MLAIKITIRKFGRLLIADEGATVLEAAVGLVVLLGLFIAIVQISLALYASHFLADAAREASRYAVVRGSMSCSTTPNLSNCNVSADEIQTWVRNLGYLGINLQQLSVSTTWSSIGSACYFFVLLCNNLGNLV